MTKDRITPCKYYIAFGDVAKEGKQTITVTARSRERS